jgi:peptide/nickel transport system ATP-binding protein
MEKSPLLSIKNFSIQLRKNKQLLLDDINLEVNSNEIVGIVGESGSGKSLTALSIMGLLNNSVFETTQGILSFNNESLLGLTSKDWQKIRGKEIAMIFQEPMSSLNPSMKCGDQIAEMFEIHFNYSQKKIKEKVLELLAQVMLPNPEKIYQSYPHQISGGQKQRVMIAIAIACKPKLLIADEPTTALDVTVQKEIVELLKKIQLEQKMSVLFISHDLTLISEIAQKVVVMYQGKIVEQGTAEDIFKHPKNAYTKGLIAARPNVNERYKRLLTLKDVINNVIPEVETNEERTEKNNKIYEKTPILELQNIEKEFFYQSGFWGKKQTFKALDNVSLKVYEGETLGIVGESGCGKTTLGNVILNMEPASGGKVLYHGKDITHLKGNELKLMRKEIQIIFQDPFASLNPRITVGNAIMEPMIVYQLHENNAKRKEKTLKIMEKVGLNAEAFHKYPHEFSGGQRQRIGIARAIALNPKVIICDESVAALDISVQAMVLNLLNELKENFGFTYLFVSHDLAVVKYMSNQVVVMNKGKIEEKEDADILFKTPKSNYAKKLIAAIPRGI